MTHYTGTSRRSGKQTLGKRKVEPKNSEIRRINRLIGKKAFPDELSEMLQKTVSY
jgi:hypothetical protein